MKNEILWYKKPAESYVYGIPLGNGRIGAVLNELQMLADFLRYDQDGFAQLLATKPTRISWMNRNLPSIP